MLDFAVPYRVRLSSGAGRRQIRAQIVVHAANDLVAEIKAKTVAAKIRHDRPADQWTTEEVKPI